MSEGVKLFSDVKELVVVVSSKMVLSLSAVQLTLMLTQMSLKNKVQNSFTSLFSFYLLLIKLK